jgi:hypothetical protein
MKKVIVLVIALIAINEVRAQWEVIPIPFYPNPGYGEWECYHRLAIGSNSTFYCLWQCDDFSSGAPYTQYWIYRTHNNGLNWPLKVFHSPDEDTGVRKLSFISGDAGFIVEKQAMGWDEVKRTANGLASFVPCNVCVYPVSINRIFKMIDFENMALVDHGIYGASAFKKLENDTIIIIYDFQPNNFVFSKIETTNDHYYLLGIDYIAGSDLVLKSKDAGYSWDTSYYNPVHNLLNIKFSSDSIGFMVGNNGMIYKTVNGGATWELKETPTINSLLSIDYMNELTWIAAGVGTILLTFDGGNIWHQIPSPNGGTVTDIRFPEKDETIVLLTDELYKTSLDILISQPEINEKPVYFKLSPNPTKNIITISLPVITDFTDFSIFNTNGEKILERQLTNTETQLDISSLPRGVYFVKLQNEKMVEVGKMVKE